MINTKIETVANQFRTKYLALGIEIDVESTGDVRTDTYFMHHDALHMYLGMEPAQEDEGVVLVAEMVLGGTYNPDVHAKLADLDIVVDLIGQLPEDVVEAYVDFYVEWFNS